MSEQECTQNRGTISCNLVLGVLSHHFATFCSLEASDYVQSTLQEDEHQEVGTPEGCFPRTPISILHFRVHLDPAFLTVLGNHTPSAPSQALSPVPHPWNHGL